MLNWSIICFIIAAMAAVYGFSGIVSASVVISKTLFFIFISLFLVTLILGNTLFRKKQTDLTAPKK